MKKTLENVVEELAQKYDNAFFLVDGDSMKGDLCRIKGLDQTKVIYLYDYMAVGSATPEILSEEFIRMRADALSGAPYGEYTVEEYERENASELRKLLEMKGAEIILLQYDCYVSQIWQLTMQAYIEQEKLAKEITRVIVCEGNHSFLAKEIKVIDVFGSHSAYCELVCNHKTIDLSRYLIDKKTVEYYLDINSEVGNLTKYICEVSSGFEDPYTACGMFLYDFQEGGLGDREFLQIAYKTLSEKTEHQDVIKKWNKERKRRNLS